MSDLATIIERDKVDPGCLALYWLSQAGFVFKSPSGAIIYVDPYFSDVVERMFGFKRMMACPITPEEVKADLIACTHEHLDHMDTDALPIIARNPRTHFAGPIECVKQFRKMGAPEDRCHLLSNGCELTIAGVKIKGVYADHGDLAADAIGLLFDFDGVRVYHTGDTAYRAEGFQPVVDVHPEIVLPCINGRYGNMNAEEASQR